jgi:ATP-dependent helicase HrpB
VRLASTALLDWLFELYPEMIDMSDKLVWNPTSELVEQVSRIAAGSVVIEEERKPAPPSPEASALLEGALRARTPPWHEADERTRALLLRLELVRGAIPEGGIPELGTTVVDGALGRACSGRTRLSELAEVDLASELLSALGSEHRALLEREAPERITLPGGRLVTIGYEPGKPPWIESNLQDFFGMIRTPTLCRGRVTLTVHLLAPNHRAVQVTNDLAGFWERHYPGIRRELSRRYPRHPWPEDGKAATPPPPKRR